MSSEGKLIIVCVTVHVMWKYSQGGEIVLFMRDIIMSLLLCDWYIPSGVCTSHIRECCRKWFNLKYWLKWAPVIQLNNRLPCDLKEDKVQMHEYVGRTRTTPYHYRTVLWNCFTIQVIKDSLSALFSMMW